MRQAWVLVTCALMLVACSREASFKADPAKRPAQAGTGEWVARVLIFSGQVRIEAANGFAFDAQPELPLLRSDRLTVGEQSFAIVHLKSERLTRLEANQSIQVAGLAGLDDPVTSQPIEQQLTGLLRADETADSSRIVGWHARMSAARTVPVQDQYKHKSEVKSFERPRAQAMAGKDSTAKSKAMRAFGPAQPKPDTAPPPPPPAAAPTVAFKARPDVPSRIKPKPPVKRRSPKLSSLRSAPVPVDKEVADLDELMKDEKMKAPPAKLGVSGRDGLAGSGVGSSTHGKGGGAKKSAKDARKSPDEVAARPALELRIGAWFAWAGGKWSSGKAPKAIRGLVRSGRLKRCFEVLLEKSPKTKLAKIQLSVKGGQIVSVHMVGGGAPAACLRGRLLGKKLLPGLADGRYRLEVRLR